MDTNIPREETERYDAWAVDDDRYAEAIPVGQPVGTTTPPLFYHESSNTVFEAQADDDRQAFVPVEGSERELGGGESLADVLEEIGDRHGWDWLSEFAEDHLEDDSR